MTTLTCNVQGDPVPVVSWTGPNGTVISNDGTKYVIESTTDITNLTITDTAPADEGVYTCSAVNVHANATAQVSLLVYSKWLTTFNCSNLYM